MEKTEIDCAGNAGVALYSCSGASHFNIRLCGFPLRAFEGKGVRDRDCRAGDVSGADGYRRSVSQGKGSTSAVSTMLVILSSSGGASWDGGGLLGVQGSYQGNTILPLIKRVSMTFSLPL